MSRIEQLMKDEVRPMNPSEDKQSVMRHFLDGLQQFKLEEQDEMLLTVLQEVVTIRTRSVEAARDTLIAHERVYKTQSEHQSLVSGWVHSIQSINGEHLTKTEPDPKITR